MKMKCFKLLVTALLVLGMSSTGLLAQEKKITKTWELSGLKTPESVIYDANQNFIFVSNVNGSPLEKNGKGFISKISVDGKMITPEWSTGLNAPKGMAIYQNTLYVSDVKQLVGIDVKTGKLLKRHSVPAAKFLNDVTADQAGNIYVSDMLDNRIYRLTPKGIFGIWVKDKSLNFPNGLYAEKDRLVVASWGEMTGKGFATKLLGNLKTVDFKTRSIANLGNGSPVGNLDGLVPDGKGNYYATDYIAGKLFQIKASGESILLQTLKPGSADHEYIISKGLMLIPLMHDNSLVAYTVK